MNYSYTCMGKGGGCTPLNAKSKSPPLQRKMGANHLKNSNLHGQIGHVRFYPKRKEEKT